MMSHTEMPGGIRVISAALGVAFLALGAGVLAVGGFAEWKTVVEGALLLIVGLDLAAGAADGHWPLTVFLFA